LADNGFIGPGAGQQRERPQENTFTRARFTGHGRKPCLKVQFDFLQEGQITDAETLQHVVGDLLGVALNARENAPKSRQRMIKIFSCTVRPAYFIDSPLLDL
jgi:hypothetical protein